MHPNYFRATPLVTLLCLFGCQGVVGLMSTPRPNPSSPDSDPELNSFPPETVDLALHFFPGTEKALPLKRLFRLTAPQLDASSQQLLAAYILDAPSQTFPKDPLQTNYLYADFLGISSTNFTPYVTWAEKTAKTVHAAPEKLINCSQQANSPACLEAEARRYLSMASRETLSLERQNQFVTFYLESVKAVGFADATADLVNNALVSPSFLFRDEVSTDGAGALLPAQQLQALSYTLADAPPDALGLSSVDAETWMASKEATVDVILGSPQVREKLMRFFLAWLEIKDPGAFTLAAEVFPEFTPSLEAAMLQEAKQFLKHHLNQPAPTLKEITQSTKSFVSDTLGPIYGQPGGAELTELDATQRLGIFTLPATIASHSGPPSLTT